MGYQKRHSRPTCNQWWKSAVLAGSLAGLAPATAGYALIIASGAADTNGAGIAGFDTVGSAGGGSGVYLGNGWVLGAAHTEATDLTLNGTYYPGVGSVTTLTTTVGTTTWSSDLILFRVGTPNQVTAVVTPVSLQTIEPAMGTQINIVGMGGWTGSVSTQYWNVNQSQTPWTWTAAAPATANAAGYSFNPNSVTYGTKRWGTSALNAGYYDSSGNYYSQFLQGGPNGAVTVVNTDAFFTGFNPTGQPTGGTSTEAAAYFGDSGGGSFASTTGKLLGITLYQDSLNGGLSGQPGNVLLFSPSALTPPAAGSGIAHNTTATYFGDVSFYAAQILAVTGIAEWTTTSAGSWTNALNWGVGTTPNAAGSTANFLSAINLPRTIALSTTVTVGAINFNNTNAYTISGAGGAIILDNTYSSTAFPAQINTFSGNHFISVPLTLDGNLVVTTAAGGGVTLSGNINTDASTRSLTKAGAGTLILSGTDSYTGGTTVSGGVLQFTSLAAIPATPATGGVTINNGGAVAVTGAYPTVTAWLNSGTIATASAGTLALIAGSSETINLTTAGAGAYSGISLGAATTATYSGTLTPLAQNYRLGGGGGTLTVSTALGDSGGATALSITGPGTVILTPAFGTNSYSGATNVSVGTLNFSALTALGTGSAINFAGGTLQYATGNAADISGRTVTLGTGGGTIDTGTNNVIFSHSIGNNGAGSLTKAGSGTLTLAAADSYSGGTTVTAGTLIVGNPGALGGGPLTLTAGTVKLQDGITAGAAPVVVSGLNLGAGKLDIRNNTMVIKSNTDISATITAEVISGALTTSFTTTSTSSGTAATTLGYLTGANYIALYGNTLPGYGGSLWTNDMVMKWTYAGDIDLSGFVNLQDYALVDAGYLAGFDGVTKIASWFNGDVNHDGKVDKSDFAILDAAVLAEGNTVLADQMITLHTQMFGADYGVVAGLADAAAVPEPASLALLGLGAMLLLKRRR